MPDRNPPLRMDIRNNERQEAPMMHPDAVDNFQRIHNAISEMRSMLDGFIAEVRAKMNPPAEEPAEEPKHDA